MFRSQSLTIGSDLRKVLKELIGQALVCFGDVDGHSIEETKVRTDTDEEY